MNVDRGGGLRSGDGRVGGQGGCEQTIEVFVKIKKKVTKSTMCN